MHPHHVTAILVGLAVGGVAGYIFAPQIATNWPALYNGLILVS